MKTPTIRAIARELNHSASTHEIGTLQELRRHRQGIELFRVNSSTTRPYWACHWGGRTELQFNIGLEDPSKLRHGVAFDFEPSRSYPAEVLIAMLEPKVKLFNRFVQRHPDICADMKLYAWDCQIGFWLRREGPAGPISRDLIAKRNSFIFLGKFQPIHRINYELILNDFDKLLRLWRCVERK